MALHLIKLCVGIGSVEDMTPWQVRRAAEAEAAGLRPLPFHITRMFPRRKAELVDGGSMYWVIRQVVQVRQRIADLEAITGEDGISRCKIWLDPELVRTQPVPRRAFQGWRYLKADEAPADLNAPSLGGAELPDELRLKLIELGAW